jgi:hypothetical protein
MMKIWGRKNAFNVQKFMWFLDELALPHDLFRQVVSLEDLMTQRF